ncbi:MAG: hypothetical protein M3042_13530 [Actinomycetota bacterium]|nr:hypothetical protein [Actinomycetota bacterium]
MRQGRRFPPPPRGQFGYARGDVDAFLARLDRDVVGIREVETVRFLNRRRSAYDVAAVDAHLDAAVARLRTQRPAPRRSLRDRA